MNRRNDDFTDWMDFLVAQLAARNWIYAVLHTDLKVSNTARVPASLLRPKTQLYLKIVETEHEADHHIAVATAEGLTVGLLEAALAARILRSSLDGARWLVSFDQVLTLATGEQALRVGLLELCNATGAVPIRALESTTYAN